VASLPPEGRNPEILRYLNRLSDLCWLLARSAEKQTAGDHAGEP
jgi:cob(I)alamin adenosyltransferase